MAVSVSRRNSSAADDDIIGHTGALEYTKNQLLRKIDWLLDFDVIRNDLTDLYSHTGRPSVDPELMLRMLLVGYLYGICSERRLVEDLRRDLEHDNAIVAKDAKLSTMKVKLKVSNADRRLLRAQLNKSQDMQFGQSSEKFPRQEKKKKGGDDFGTVGAGPDGNDPNTGGAEAKPEADKPKPHGKLGRQATNIPENIPRNKTTISPPDGSVCQCGCGMAKIGEETIERLTYVPAQLRVIEERYPKYVCRTCDKLVQAPVPKRAFEQTRFDDRLIAGLAVSKFADYMPNYRQEQIFMRSGVKLHRSTMGCHMDQAVDALLPPYNVLNKDLNSSSKLLMDETTLAQLMPGTGKTKTCFVWAMCRDDRRWKGNAHRGVAFHFKQSRKGEHAEEILHGFKGTL